MIFKRKKNKSNPPAEAPKNNLFSRLRSGLKRTGEGFTQLFASKKIDADLLEELQDQLLIADVGIEASESIIDDLQKQISRKEIDSIDTLRSTLMQIMAQRLQPCEAKLELTPEHQPYIILVVGVNGAGKTTTIGKLTKRFQTMGKSVMLAAGDTFRAAAIEQLQAWGERNQVPVIAQQSGSDSAAVIYDAIQAAKARQIDVLIADTAGRLHTQQNLMEELKKVTRVIGRADEFAPHETLLVLDATQGQNALQQAKQFHQATNVTGIALTKLDGTAKGGIIFAIAHQLNLPIRFIGIGEQVDDLQTFNAEQFCEALFSNIDNNEGNVS